MFISAFSRKAPCFIVLGKFFAGRTESNEGKQVLSSVNSLVMRSIKNKNFLFFFHLRHFVKTRMRNKAFIRHTSVERRGGGERSERSHAIYR